MIHLNLCRIIRPIILKLSTLKAKVHIYFNLPDTGFTQFTVRIYIQLLAALHRADLLYVDFEFVFKYNSARKQGIVCTAKYYIFKYDYIAYPIDIQLKEGSNPFTELHYSLYRFDRHFIWKSLSKFSIIFLWNKWTIVKINTGHLCITVSWYCICREVFKARDRQTRRLVAMKKVLMENEKEGVTVHIFSL